MMRLFILPYAAWMGLLPLAVPIGAASDLPRLVATAGVLGSLTVLVYRLGVWRQEMENAKSSVGATCARIERQLEAIDHVIADYMEFKQKAERRHRHTARRLEKLEDNGP